MSAEVGPDGGNWGVRLGLGEEEIGGAVGLHCDHGVRLGGIDGNVGKYGERGRGNGGQGCNASVKIEGKRIRIGAEKIERVARRGGHRRIGKRHGIKPVFSRPECK